MVYIEMIRDVLKKDLSNARTTDRSTDIADFEGKKGFQYITSYLRINL